MTPPSAVQPPCAQAGRRSPLCSSRSSRPLGPVPSAWASIENGWLAGRPSAPARGPALGLQRLGVDQQRMLGPEVEIQVQEIAEMQQALDRDGAGLAATAPLQAQPALHGVEAALGAEGRQGLHREGERFDVDAHRLGARTPAAGTERRPAQHPHALGGGGVDLQPAAQQGAIAPAHGEPVGFEPDTLLVGNGEAADGEVAPDVAAQPVDLQHPQPAQLDPAGARFDQQPGLRRQHAIARGGQPQGDEQHEDRQAEHGTAQDGPRQQAARRRPRWLGRAQKAWPMLM